MTNHNRKCYNLYIMQPITELENVLEQISSPERFLYSRNDLKNLFPHFSDSNLNMLLSRAVKRGKLARICKGIYLYTKVPYNSSVILYKTASKLRASWINYVSLETVLAAHSIISQQLPNWLTVMTTGRRGIITCGSYGTVEFIHTAKKITDIKNNLFLNERTGMLEAKPHQAYLDMVDAKRQALDLVDMEVLKEYSDNE